MMQAERDESTIEGVGFERQSIGSGGALIIGRNRVFVPVADVEHSESLIDADDPAAFKPFRNRPRNSAGAGRQVENYFVPFQRKHVGQFFSEISADLGNSAIKISRVLRVIEPRLVIVAVAMLMTVPVPMIVCVAMFVIRSMCMVVFVCVLVATMLMAVAMSLLVFMRVIVTVIVFMSMLLAMSVAMIMFVLVAVTGFVTFVSFVVTGMSVIMFAFVCHFSHPPYFSYPFLPNIGFAFPTKLSYKALSLQGTAKQKRPSAHA